jgi:hypothetical protein
MNALPSHVPLLTPPPARSALSPEALAACVRALDPGSRALLDLSLRRKLPFEAMAGVLHTDPFDLARRRARAVARIAAELDLEGAGVVATVKAALARLPDDAWGVPCPPKKEEPADAVQAESMADAARALMVKLEEHRARIREATIAAAANPFDGDEPAPTPAPAADPSQQPTVEMEAIVLPEPEPAAVEAWEPAPAAPVAATDMAAAFAHHPAFAVEAADEAAALPPLAEALARAAESERAAAETATQDPAEQPTMETPAIRIPVPPTDRPAPPLSAPPADEREPRRRLARGGLIVGLLLALLRLLVGRR